MVLQLGGADLAFVYKYDIPASVQWLVSSGFRYIEISTAFSDSRSPQGICQATRLSLRQIVDKHGLRVAVNPTGLDLNFASSHPAIREASVREYMYNIDLVSDLGGELLVACPGRLHGLMRMPFEQAWETAKPGVLEAADYAKKRGVRIALENVGAYGFSETVDQLREMIEDVNHESVGIAYDVANAPRSEYPPAAIAEIAESLIHIHLSDRANEWGHLPIGMGTIDFEGIADSLENIGFKGVSVLEVGCPEAPHGAIVDSIRRLKSLGWRL